MKDELSISRRSIMLRTLFGAGGWGLRALATGMPGWMLTQPLRAWAQGPTCPERGKAQHLILSTSSAGDPLNANVPGTYDFPDIVHAADPLMAPTPLALGARTFTAARVWSTLPKPVLDRTCFFHHATYTNNHPNLPKVLRLMGATARSEMVPSLIAQQLAPCLGTVQTEPLSVGAGEILTFEGRGLPNLNPTGLRDLLTRPAGALSRLQQLRDKHLDRMHAALKAEGNSAQRAYLDRVALSRGQARSLSDDLLGALDGITSNGAEGATIAAVTLIRMNVAPVVVVRFNFGGDNHADQDLARFEVPQHESGLAQIAGLMQALQTHGLQDRVTFALSNVFGRTLKKLGRAGRDHWASHHVTVMMGSTIKPGVVGGLEPKAGDYYATGFDSRTGRSGAGDVPFAETLGAMGKTLGAAVGVPASVLDQQIATGKIVRAALV